MYGTFIGLSGRGEMLPNDDTYCEIDPTTVDEWGIPVLRFHFRWGEADYRDFVARLRRLSRPGA